MNLFHLKVFKALTEKMSFSKTAEDLFLTQPAVSQQIRSLEEHFKCKLFLRSKNKVEPTNSGKILYTHVNKILLDWQAAENEIFNAVNVDTKKILVGASTTLGYYILPNIIGGFKEKHPEVLLILEVANTQDITKRIYSDVIDIGLVEAKIKDENVVVEKYIEDELVLVCSVLNPLAKRKEINKDELLSLPLIIREDGSGSRHTIHNILRNNHIRFEDLNIKLELGGSEAVKAAVESNIGVSFISKWAIMKEVKYNVLKIIKVKGLNLKRDLNIVHSKQGFRSKIIEEFYLYLKSYKLS